jgi:hypothetical protein
MGYFPVSQELRKVQLRTTSKDQLLAYSETFLHATPSAPGILWVPPYYSDPEGNRAAVRELEHDSDAALSLALAYRVTGKRDYLDKAVDYLSCWSGMTDVRRDEAQLQLVYRGYKFLEAMHHLQFGIGMALIKPFLEWVDSTYVPAAVYIMDHPNNWGAWGRCGFLYAAKLTGSQVSSRMVDDLLWHLKGAVDPHTGLLPRELQRGPGNLWYHYFAAAPYTHALLTVREVAGVDHTSLLTKTYDNLYGACLYPETWVWGEQGPVEKLFHPGPKDRELPSPTGWPSDLLEVVATRILHRPQYLEYVHRPLITGHCFRFSTFKWAHDFQE